MASTILRPLNKSKYPEQRIKYDYKKFFPNLGDEYEVLAPNTGDYKECS